MGEIHSNLSGSAWHKTALARMCPQREETPVQPAIEVKAERIEHHDKQGHTLILTVDGYWKCKIWRYDNGNMQIELGSDDIRNYVDIDPEDFAKVAAIIARAHEIMQGGKEP